MKTNFLTKIKPLFFLLTYPIVIFPGTFNSILFLYHGIIIPYRWLQNILYIVYLFFSGWLLRRLARWLGLPMGSIARGKKLVFFCIFAVTFVFIFPLGAIELLHFISRLFPALNLDLAFFYPYPETVLYMYLVCLGYFVAGTLENKRKAREDKKPVCPC